MAASPLGTNHLHIMRFPAQSANCHAFCLMHSNFCHHYIYNHFCFYPPKYSAIQALIASKSQFESLEM